MAAEPSKTPPGKGKSGGNKIVGKSGGGSGRRIRKGREKTPS